MELTPTTVLLLPIGLGLLGFVEPCTVGAHLIYLRSQDGLSISARMRSLAVFVLARAAVMGLFGALIAFAGETLIEAQTLLWLLFGLIYVVLGGGILAGRSRLLSLPIRLAPALWSQSKSPVLLGLAFGLNIPACAAPILFGLLGMAASIGSVATGFLVMALFGVFLSLPLGLFLYLPDLARRLRWLQERTPARRWLTGIAFLALGVWSIWFGMQVDPRDWAGQ